MFSCCGAPYTHLSRLCFCYYGWCWGCWTLHQVSQPVSSGGPIYYCGEGNVIFLQLGGFLFWLVIFLLNLEVFWLYSEHLASAMLAAIKDDQFIHVNLSETAWSMASLNSFSNDLWSSKHSNYIAQQLYNLSIHFQLSQLINGHYQQLSNQDFMVFRTWH